MDHNYCKDPPVTYNTNLLISKANDSRKQERVTLERSINKSCAPQALMDAIYRKGTNIPRKPHKNQTHHVDADRPRGPVETTIKSCSFDFHQIYRKGTNVPRKPNAIVTPQMIKQRRELRTMRARVARLKKRMDKLKRAHKIAQKTTERSNDKLLSEKLSREAATIFKNNLKNEKRQPKGRRYSKELKEFASTLLGHSPKAYAFCRKTLCLPDPMSIGCGRSEKPEKEKIYDDFISVSPEHASNYIVNDDIPDQTIPDCTIANAMIWEWNEETGEISGTCNLASGVLGDTNNFIVYT